MHTTEGIDDEKVLELAINHFKGIKQHLDALDNAPAIIKMNPGAKSARAVAQDSVILVRELVRRVVLTKDSQGEGSDEKGTETGTRL